MKKCDHIPFGLGKVGMSICYHGEHPAIGFQPVENKDADFDYSGSITLMSFSNLESLDDLIEMLTKMRRLFLSTEPTQEDEEK